MGPSRREVGQRRGWPVPLHRRSSVVALRNALARRQHRGRGLGVLVDLASISSSIGLLSVPKGTAFDPGRSSEISLGAGERPLDKAQRGPKRVREALALGVEQLGELFQLVADLVALALEPGDVVGVAALGFGGQPLGVLARLGQELSRTRSRAPSIKTPACSWASRTAMSAVR